MRVILTQLREWLEGGEKNFDQMLRSTRRSPRATITEADILVLPELVGAELERKTYLDCVRRVDGDLGTCVVGGSHHHVRGAKTLNGGTVVSPDGSLLPSMRSITLTALKALSASAAVCAQRCSKFFSR